MAELIDQGEFGQGENAPPSRISREVFFQSFCGVFMVGYLPRPFPFPLASMPIQPEEMQAARAASDVLYEICEEVHFLNFLLEPQGKWAGQIMAIGFFMVPKCQAILAEVAEKTAARRAAEREKTMRDVSPQRSEAPPTSDVKSEDTQTL